MFLRTDEVEFLLTRPLAWRRPLQRTSPVPLFFIYGLLLVLQTSTCICDIGKSERGLDYLPERLW